jgi:hypothetical protein
VLVGNVWLSCFDTKQTLWKRKHLPCCNVAHSKRQQSAPDAIFNVDSELKPPPRRHTMTGGGAGAQERINDVASAAAAATVSATAATNAAATATSAAGRAEDMERDASRAARAAGYGATAAADAAGEAEDSAAAAAGEASWLRDRKTKTKTKNEDEDEDEAPATAPVVAVETKAAPAAETETAAAVAAVAEITGEKKPSEKKKKPSQASGARLVSYQPSYVQVMALTAEDWMNRDPRMQLKSSHNGGAKRPVATFVMGTKLSLERNWSDASLYREWLIVQKAKERQEKKDQKTLADVSMGAAAAGTGAAAATGAAMKVVVSQHEHVLNDLLAKLLRNSAQGMPQPPAPAAPAATGDAMAIDTSDYDTWVEEHTLGFNEQVSSSSDEQLDRWQQSGELFGANRGGAPRQGHCLSERGSGLSLPGEG